MKEKITYDMNGNIVQESHISRKIKIKDLRNLLFDIKNQDLTIKELRHILYDMQQSDEDQIQY